MKTSESESRLRDPQLRGLARAISERYEPMYADYLRVKKWLRRAGRILLWLLATLLSLVVKKIFGW